MIDVLTVHAGHGNPGGRGCGAKKYLDESKCAREILTKYKAKLKKYNVDYTDVTYYGNASSTTILKSLCKWMNNQFEPDIINLSIHLNSSVNPYANGVECLVYGPNSAALDLANKLCICLNAVCGYKNRGVKYRKGLYILKHTLAPTVILEAGFVSSKTDASKYDPENIASAMMRATRNAEYV